MSSELLSTIAILLLIILLCSLKYWLNPLRKIPGPAGLPFIGNMLDFYRNEDQHELLQRWTKKYGPIFKYYLPFGGWKVYLADPQYAKQILVTNYSKYIVSEARKKFMPAFGSGIICSNGKLHVFQRKHLSPAFSLGNIQKYMPIFNLKGNELLKFWETQIKLNNDKPIEEDVLLKFTHVTLDAIGLSSFGYSFNCIAGGHHEESLAADKILTGNFNILQRSIECMFPLLKMIPSKERTDLENAEKSFHGLINKVVKARKDGFLSNQPRAKERNDLLQTLFTMYQNEDEETEAKNIFHQVFSFMIAGHESTSVAMTWTMYCLAKHPEIQKKAQKEVYAAIGNSREVLWEDFKNLKYLEYCIKEAMRLYPSVIHVSRTAIEEDRFGPYKIPVGTNFLVGFGTISRNSSFWKDPDSYIPERFDFFANDSTEAKASLANWYLPFSCGPRMCMGQRFAQAELRVVLALLLRSFSFKLGKNQPVDVETRDYLALKPSQPIMLEISLAE